MGEHSVEVWYGSKGVVKKPFVESGSWPGCGSLHSIIPCGDLTATFPQITTLLKVLSVQWQAKSYDRLVQNCQDFVSAVLAVLRLQSLPSFVTRAPWVGRAAQQVSGCVLPSDCTVLATEETEKVQAQSNAEVLIATNVKLVDPCSLDTSASTGTGGGGYPPLLHIADSTSLTSTRCEGLPCQRRSWQPTSIALIQIAGDSPASTPRGDSRAGVTYLEHSTENLPPHSARGAHMQNGSGYCNCKTVRDQRASDLIQTGLGTDVCLHAAIIRSGEPPVGAISV